MVVAAADKGFLWPLEIDPAVSSNFCEYRVGHFHSGIDIRTFGAEGVPCVSAGDGHVSRLRASPAGYGKAVYIQLEGGETLVYAHVAEFSPPLEEVLYEAQSREGRFSVDVRFPRDRFPVRRGEVVAYSGSTGGTAPHLHFEIRDEGEHPLNPFSNGFAPVDRFPPVFNALELVPLSTNARIDGRCWPFETIVGSPSSGGLYSVADTLAISGDVGVAVQVYERLGGRSGKLTPYRVTLSVDDSLVADIRMERFSFSQTGQVDFLYDISRVRREKAYFLQLFRSDGETIPDRWFRGGGRLGRAAGAEGPSGAVHHAAITAFDLAGNESELSFWFHTRAHVDDPRRTIAKGERPVRTDIPGFFFRDGFVSIWNEADRLGLPVPASTSADPGAAGAHAGGRGGGVYSAADLRDGPFSALDGETFLIGVEKDQPTSVSFPQLDLQLISGQRSLYTDMVFYASAWSDTAQAVNPGELVPRADPVCIGPYTATLRADVEIRFLADRLDSAAAIYRLDERKGEWVYYESTVYRGVVSTTAKRPGVYAVFADKYGPRIRKPFVKKWTSYATGEMKPEIVVPVEDAGSGVDFRKTSVYLAGIEQITYWDNLSKKLLVVIRDQNIMGPQVFSVVAYDRIGNRSHLETTVDIPRIPLQQGKD